MKLIEIFQDGACYNHSEHHTAMGIGVAVFVDKEYQEELSRAIHIQDKEGSSNVAEWLACVEALKIASELKCLNCIIKIFSDSKIIVNQFNGIFAIKNDKFISYFKRAKDYAKSAKINSINWIPREQNRDADRLSKLGLHDKKYRLRENSQIILEEVRYNRVRKI